MKKHLELDYFLSKGIPFEEACVLIESICSCAIENPKCAEKETVDNVIDKFLRERIKK